MAETYKENKEQEMPTITGLDSGVVVTNNTLHIRGAPDKYNYRTLWIKGPTASSGNIDLFMPSPPANEMTLTFVGAPSFPTDAPTGVPPALPGVIFQNGVLGLVANGSFGSGVPGASGMQNVANLSISPMSESGFPSDTPLPGVIFQNGVVGLTAFSSGTFEQNNNLTFNVSGNLDSASGNPPLFVQGSGFETTRGFAPITIFHFGSETRASGAPTLSIKTDFNVSNNTTLHINSRGSRGFLTASIEGRIDGTGNIPLSIRTDENTNVNLYTRGFLE